MNFTAVASDAQVPRTTVYEYFDILRDTLVLHEVPAWTRSSARKPLVSPKYYLFDIGVASWLQGRPVRKGTPEFGPAFETWLLHELVCHRDYAGGAGVSHWRSASGYEVDFVLGDHTAIEVKAKENVAPRELRGLLALAEERPIKNSALRQPRPSPPPRRGDSHPPVRGVSRCVVGGRVRRLTAARHVAAPGGTLARPARLATTAASSAVSIGLARWIWKPRCSAITRSSARAYAVSATAGTRPPRSGGKALTFSIRA